MTKTRSKAKVSWSEGTRSNLCTLRREKFQKEISTDCHLISLRAKLRLSLLQRDKSILHTSQRVRNFYQLPSPILKRTSPLLTRQNWQIVSTNQTIRTSIIAIFLLKLKHSRPMKLGIPIRNWPLMKSRSTWTRKPTTYSSQHQRTSSVSFLKKKLQQETALGNTSLWLLPLLTIQGSLLPTRSMRKL